MSLLSIIHIAKAQLGMDDETYRAFLQNVTGKSSCAKMTTMELWEVAEALKGVGFVKAASPKKQAAPADPQHSKIRALWLSMADAGIVRNRAENALNQYVTRITGRELANAASNSANPSSKPSKNGSIAWKTTNYGHNCWPSSQATPPAPQK